MSVLEVIEARPSDLTPPAPPKGLQERSRQDTGLRLADEDGRLHHPQQAEEKIILQISRGGSQLARTYCPRLHSSAFQCHSQNT